MKNWDVGDWILAFVAIVIVGLLVWFLVWIIGSSSERSRALYDCQTAGYVATVWFGETCVCVGTNVETGEFVAVSLERVRLGTNGGE